MLNYIEKLRRMPIAERKRSILLISLSITLGIAAVWATVLAVRISSMDFDSKDGAEKADVPSLSETFSNFASELEKIWRGAETYENPAAETVSR